MNGDHWHRIETVFAEALARPADAREKFLNDACAGEPSMRAELDSLLKAHLEHGSFLETASLDEPDGGKVHATPPLLPGTRLGAFEIVALLGAGGMGAVYHARDTRLDRGVALKVLTSRLDRHDAGRRRLEREAVAISRLTHPHICTLHDIARAPVPPGDVDVEFLVMELVRGETLAELIARGPLAVARALPYSIEMADALACAHGEGIVHRDLKPQNMMITPEGVKLLDFGLAEFTASKPGTADRPAMAGVPGTAQVYGARADSRREGRQPCRCVQPWPRRARNAQWQTGFRTADDSRNAAGDFERRRPAAARDRSRRAPADRGALPREGAGAAISVGIGSGSGFAIGACLGAFDCHRRHGGHEGPAPATMATPQRHAVGRPVSGRCPDRCPDRCLEMDRSPEPADHPAGQADKRRAAENRRPGHRRVTSVSVGAGRQNAVPCPSLDSGGDTTPVAIPFPNPGLDDISHSGSQLIVGSYVEPGPFPYWMVPLSGAPPRRVAIFGSRRASLAGRAPDRLRRSSRTCS